MRPRRCFIVRQGDGASAVINTTAGGKVRKALFDRTTSQQRKRKNKGYTTDELKEYQQVFQMFDEGSTMKYRPCFGETLPPNRR